TGPRLSQLYPPCATPSSNFSLDYRRSDARIVENGFAASSGVNKSAKVVLALAGRLAQRGGGMRQILDVDARQRGGEGVPGSSQRRHHHLAEQRGAGRRAGHVVGRAGGAKNIVRRDAALLAGELVAAARPARALEDAVHVALIHALAVGFAWSRSASVKMVLLRSRSADRKRTRAKEHGDWPRLPARPKGGNDGGRISRHRPDGQGHGGEPAEGRTPRACMGQVIRTVVRAETGRRRHCYDRGRRFSGRRGHFDAAE